MTVRDLFAASLIAADPTAFTARAVRLRLPVDRRLARPIWIIAIGKAAHTMTRAAVQELADRNVPVAGGLIIGPTLAESPHPEIRTVAGDHPLPGPQSLEAAHALGELCDRIPGGDHVFVLLSGGASSLTAAPAEGVSSEDLLALCQMLLASGLDIGRVNAIRKRFLRWGAGRLAAQLAPTRTELIVLSDVIGDNLAYIGCGPCVPDPLTAVDVRRLLDETHLSEQVAPALLRYLDDVMKGERPETPKSEAPCFLFSGVPAVQGNGGVLEAGALRARVLGFDPVVIVSEPLMGEAAPAGMRIAVSALALPRGAVALWGGETTVTLPPGTKGGGGRCQEMMLAAAIELSRAGAGASGVTLLAAGTDGRDGPTDAAGAIIDALTVARMLDAGVDPQVALSRHESFEALHRAGALLKTGLTGTNVGDVVVAVRM